MPRHLSFSVFISYRRADSGDVISNIESALAKIPHVSVFRDIGGIDPGADYIAMLQKTIDDADLFLVIIGPDWVGGTVPGKRRIDEASDVVRREIEWRLRRRPGKRSKYDKDDALPVLVKGASMPGKRSLPPSMQRLTDFNAINVSEARPSDLQELTAAITAIFDAKELEFDATFNELLALDEKSEPVEERHELNTVISAPELPGTWEFDIESDLQNDRVAPFGHLSMRLVVESDCSMTGSMRLRRPGLFGFLRTRKMPIEGSLEWMYVKLAGEDRYYPIVRVKGVAGRTDDFALNFHLQQQFGNTFHGRDPEGRRYTMRQRSKRSL